VESGNVPGDDLAVDTASDKLLDVSAGTRVEDDRGDGVLVERVELGVGGRLLATGVELLKLVEGRRAGGLLLLASVEGLDERPSVARLGKERGVGVVATGDDLVVLDPQERAVGERARLDGDDVGLAALDDREGRVVGDPRELGAIGRELDVVDPAGRARGTK